ncbi:MAG: hypothetical protein WBK97_06310 [Bacteroidales bacterium]|jgi:hypothetical protein
MKKILNLFAVVSLVALFLTSCNVEKINPVYTPDAAGYSFIAKAYTFTLPAANPVFKIKVFRNTTEGTGTVTLTPTASHNVFNVPGTLSFDNGKGDADLTISLKPEASIGVVYTLKLSISSQEASVGGVKEVEMKINLAYNWISLGNGQFCDTWTLYSIPTVEIRQAEGFDRWRVMQPYTKALLLEAEWDDWIGGPQSAYIEFWEEGGFLKWDTNWYAGLLYGGDAGSIIKHYYPSALSASLAAYNELSLFLPQYNRKVARLRPAVYIDGLGGWHTSNNYCYVGFPGGPDLNDIL